MGRPRTAERETVTCLVCGKKFEERTSKHRRICSSKCRGVYASALYASRRVQLVCVFCGKRYAVVASRGVRSRFCSLKCKNTVLARKHAEARGDRKRYSGAGVFYIKYHSRHLHRVIAERMLGRLLGPDEVVHHINGDLRDNRAENLAVLKNQAEHARIHSIKNRKCSVAGCGKKHAARGYCGKHWRQWHKGKLAS